MVASIVSTQKNKSNLLRYLERGGCDTEENGGYSGTMNKKPLPFGLEERPATIDPKTGERVYLDQIDPKDRFRLFGIFA